MNTSLTCPQCGSTLPADAPEGLCPACLMKGGFDTDATIKLTPSQKSATHAPAAPAPEELAPLFPQLEIIELLGRGGMGAVYKARQPKLNRFVALKIISGDAATDPHFAERFQREAQALAKLNHPHIVSVFDFGETGGLFYFLMEFVDGANLRTLMQSGEMKPEAALALIPSFCDALQYAHDEGVVHRDIKPENVLVDKKGRLKIADFGLAKLTGSDAHDHTLTRTGMYLGTPRYMAPEQVEKPETVDHRADIYSLGVVFYEMLTGELPMGRFDPPSKKVVVDVKLDDIVLRSLEKDVDRRYQHASEIKSDVQSMADGGVVQASPHVGKASVPAAKVGGIPAAAASPKSMSHSPALLAQINARSIEMMIAGIALVIGGLFGCIYGMTVAADYASKVTNPADNVASRAALGALMHLSVFLCGIAAFISSLGVRKLRWHPFALVMSILLMLVLPGVLFAIGLMSRNDLVLLQFAYPFYAGLRAFLLLRKPAVEAAFAAERGVLRPASPPSEDARLSRMALIGAIWAFLGIIAVIPSMMLSQTVNLAEGRPSGLVYEQPPVAFTVFMAVLLFIGMGAPIGTTILGAISMSNIKKSGGKLYGLPLAFADTVLFPMLLLHGAMAVMLGLLIVSIMKIAGVTAGLGAAEMGLLAMLPLIADFFIVRALWRKVAGTADATAKGDPASKLNLAGVGLLLAGIADAFAGLLWAGQNVVRVVEAIQHDWPVGWLVAETLLSLCILSVVYYVIGAALFLMRHEHDGDITFPLIIAAIVPPGCFVGLPAAIYAFVLLSRPEVKALFPQAKPEAETAAEPEKILRWESWWFGRTCGAQKVMSVILGVVLVLSLICFLSFRMQTTTTADHSGVVRNLYDVTVGLGDPWLYILHHKTGTRGGMTSGMNFVAGSALFGLAALFAGTALTRLTREQKRRGKLADVSTDIPQRRFFWQAVAGAAFFIAGGAGVIVHQAKIDQGPRWADAKQVHPDFTRPGVTNLALKKEIAEELRLTQQQLEQVNAVLSRAYLDFLKLENDHSLFRSVKGRLVKEVKPFPDRSFDLAQRLAKELRDVAGKDIIDTPARGEVWKLRLFGHAGEFNVRAEIWQQDGKFHIADVWEREGEKITGTSEGVDSLRFVGSGAYVLDWEAQKEILHETKPDEETTGYSKGWDTMLVFIGLVRMDELAQMLATDPKAVRAAADPRAALVTQANTLVGRASAETQLKLHGIPFAKDATAEDLLKKLEQLLGVPPES